MAKLLPIVVLAAVALLYPIEALRIPDVRTRTLQPAPAPAIAPAPMVPDPRLREKRQSMAYRFGDGIEYLIPTIHETFSCLHREYGYYADIDNNCQIFHVCVPPEQQYSFFCPNQTIFDQRLLICQDQYTATPCQEAERFYVINQNFGVIGAENRLSVEV